MAAPTYGPSTYGRTVVKAENFVDGTPLNRYMFIASHVMLLAVGFAYVLTTIRRLLQQRQHTRTPGQSSIDRLAHGTVFAFLVCHFLLGAHFVDHTARPVDYQEPKLVYQPYLIGPMESTFYLNYLITAVSTYSITHLFVLDAQRRLAVTASRRPFYALAYFLISGFTGPAVHYTTAPLREYDVVGHVTIGGTGVAALVLTVLAVKCWQQVSGEQQQQKEPHQYSKLPKEEDDVRAEATTRTSRRRSPFRPEEKKMSKK